MIQLFIGDRELDLDPEFQMAYEFNHPLSDDDGLNGSYSIGGVLPLTNNNVITLKHADCINLKNRTKIFDVYVLTFGIRKSSAKMVISDFEIQLQGEAINVDFIINGFSVDILDKTLRDIDYGDDIELGTTIEDRAAACSVLNTSSEKVCFPLIYAPEFYGSSNSQFDGFLNNWDLSAQEFVLNGLLYNKNSMVPQIKLKFLLERIYATIGYSITGTFFNDPITDKMFLFCNKAIDYNEPKYDVFATRTSTQTIGTSGATIVFNDDSTGENHDDENVYNTSNGQYTTQNGGMHFLNCNFKLKHTGGGTGVVYFAHFNIKVGGFIGLVHTYQFNAINTVEDVSFTVTQFIEPSSPSLPEAGDTIEIEVFFLQGALTSATGEVRADSTIEIYNRAEMNTNRFASSIQINKIVPNFKIDAFLSSFRFFPGASISLLPGLKQVRMDWINAQFKGKIEDLTERLGVERTFILADEEGFKIIPQVDLKDVTEDEKELPDISEYEISETVIDKESLGDPINLNEVKFVQNEGVSYIVKFNTTSNDFEWMVLSYDYQEKTIGSGQKEVKMEMIPIVMKEATLGAAQVLVPYTNAKGASPEFGLGDTKPPMMLGMWHGLQPNYDDDNYPFASPFRWNMKGDELEAVSLSLSDSDTAGVWLLYIKPFLVSTQIPEILKGIMEVDDNFITSLDPMTRYTVDGIHFYLRSMNVVYAMDGLSLAEIELQKLS